MLIQISVNMELVMSSFFSSHEKRKR